MIRRPPRSTLRLTTLSLHDALPIYSVEGLTPQYAAPEQFDDAFGATDDRTDVYQLGAVCYELFTGRPPFDGETASVPRSVLEAEPQPPSEFASLPPALDDVLLTALATEKADRYDDIVYFRDDLRDCYERVRSE
jgi:serine/threonine protein kinase